MFKMEAAGSEIFNELTLVRVASKLAWACYGQFTNSLTNVVSQNCFLQQVFGGKVRLREIQKTKRNRRNSDSQKNSLKLYYTNSLEFIQLPGKK